MPVQTMKLANDLFPAVLGGSKRVTIRAGRRDVNLGRMAFVAADLERAEAENTRAWVAVEVHEVRHLRAGGLDDATAWAEGHDDAAALRVALRRFYPGLSDSDEVTAIFFTY